MRFFSFCVDNVFLFFFFQAEDGIRDKLVTGVQTCALPIFVPISATSGTLPPAIAVTNLSCACAHGTNWMLTFVPGFAASKSLPYWLTTPWIFGEPGSMI